MQFTLPVFHSSWVHLEWRCQGPVFEGGDFIERELYLLATDTRSNPGILLPPGQLARVRKSIFGLGCTTILVASRSI